MSATPDSTFTDQQQVIADLQRERDEARAERDEALAREAATAEVLQVINASPGDLAPVFDAILEKAHSLCGAEHGALATFDGEYFRAVALRAMPEPFGELLRQPFRSAAAGSAQRRLLQGERLIHIPDVRTVGPVTPIQHAALEAGIRTLLMVPLRQDDRMLGYITATRLEVRPFTDKQIALLQNFAAQAVIAMENARLLTETQEALEQQTATAEVLGVINSSPGNLTPVFDAILEKARQRTGAIHGDLWTYDGECFHLVATHGEPGFSEWLRQQGPMHPWAGSGIERLLKGEDYVHLDDALDDDGLRLAPEFLKQHKIAGIRTVLAVPLRKEGIVLGLITVYRREVLPFTDKQMALLQNFAAQAVIAIENARLLTETRQRTADLQESLEYQTATSDVLNVISRSTADVQPVLDTVMETAARLCGADTANITIREGEVYRHAASTFSAADPEYWAIQRQRRYVPGRDSITGRVALVMSRTSARIRTMRFPSTSRPGYVPPLECRCCARRP